MIDWADRASALLWIERCISVALALQTVELLQARRAFSDAGVWSWSLLKEEQRELVSPLRWLLAMTSPYPAFITILALRLVLTSALVLGVSHAALPLLLSQVAINARFRGTFNGGSDYMSVVVLLALSLASFFPTATAETASLAYCCVQLVMSYFIAGIVKLARREWRSGEALARLLASGRYGGPGPWRRLAEHQTAMMVASWSVLLFESTFPLVLYAPELGVSVAALALTFHVVNAYAFGLNRFVWAWLAAYPALLHFCAILQAR